MNQDQENNLTGRDDRLINLDRDSRPRLVFSPLDSVAS